MEGEERSIKVLLEGILHGDDEHRRWLQEAVYAWLDGKEIPKPKGFSKKEEALRDIINIAQKALYS